MAESCQVKAARGILPAPIENGLDDLPHRPTPSPSALAWRRQIWFDQMPFGIGKIASIAKLCAAMMRTGGRVPHDGFQGWCRNPSESYRNSAVHRCDSVLTQPLRRTSMQRTVCSQKFKSKRRTVNKGRSETYKRTQRGVRRSFHPCSAAGMTGRNGVTVDGS